MKRVEFDRLAFQIGIDHADVQVMFKSVYLARKSKSPEAMAAVLHGLVDGEQTLPLMMLALVMLDSDALLERTDMAEPLAMLAAMVRPEQAAVVRDYGTRLAEVFGAPAGGAGLADALREIEALDDVRSDEAAGIARRALAGGAKRAAMSADEWVEASLKFRAKHCGCCKAALDEHGLPGQVSG